jgi:hypothetical protein
VKYTFRYVEIIQLLEANAIGLKTVVAKWEIHTKRGGSLVPNQVGQEGAATVNTHIPLAPANSARRRCRRSKVAAPPPQRGGRSSRLRGVETSKKTYYG